MSSIAAMIWVAARDGRQVRGRHTPIFSAGRALRTASVEQAARQARDVPVFGRTGNFNSLFGQKISLFGCVGNFAGTASNRWAFLDGFSEIGRKPADFPVLFPLTREFGRARLRFLGSGA
jgi:hypothetical protein